MTSLIGIAALGACQQPGIATKHRMMCERDSHLVIIDREGWAVFLSEFAKAPAAPKQWFGRSVPGYLVFPDNLNSITGKDGVVRDDFMLTRGIKTSPIARIINFSYSFSAGDFDPVITCEHWSSSRYRKDFAVVR